MLGAGYLLDFKSSVPGASYAVAVGSGLRGRTVEIGQNHNRTALREMPCIDLANPTGRTGDECNASVECSHDAPPRSNA